MFYEEYEEDPPVGIDYARKLLLAIKDNNAKFENNFKKLDMFFGFVLEPFYSPLNESGVSMELGHIIYRLAQLIPIETRIKIKTYPSSFKRENEKDFNDGSETWDWYSLEEWCLEWFDRNKGIIPEMTKELEETKSLLLLPA